MVPVGLYFAGVALHAYLGYRCERKQARRISRLASRYFTE